MNIISIVMLTLVGLIHLLPLSGVFGPERLLVLYGAEITDRNLLILMQHRAVLFGLLGCFLIYSAFVPDLRKLAYISAFVSVGSFLIIAWSNGQYNDQISNVVFVDIVAVALLCVGVFSEVLSTATAVQNS